MSLLSALHSAPMVLGSGNGGLAALLGVTAPEGRPRPRMRGAARGRSAGRTGSSPERLVPTWCSDPLGPRPGPLPWLPGPVAVRVCVRALESRFT